jgi:hypothetical protein
MPADPLVMPRGVSHVLAVYSTESGSQGVVGMTSGWCLVALEADVHLVHEVLTQRNASPSRYYCTCVKPGRIDRVRSVSVSSWLGRPTVSCWEDGSADGARRR